MGLFILVLLGYSVVVIPTMVHKKQWKEMLVFSTITLMGITLAVLFIFKVDLPMIGTGIANLLKKLYQMVGIRL